jgi:rubrerythrin
MTERNYWQLAEHFRKRCNELQEKLDRMREQQIEHYRTTDHWLQRIQRLQTLQPEQMTLEELEAVNDELPEYFVSSDAIAAVCRGMTREVKGNG